MFIYLFIFVVSPILFDVAYTRYRKGQEYKIYIFLSILLLCLISGLRSVEVGTDVAVYQLSFFNLAKSYDSMIDYCMDANSIEYMYLIINYLVTCFSDSINVFFFWIEIVALSPIYYVAWKCKNIFTPSIVLLVYVTMFYIETYNVLRQTIAISYVLLTMYYYYTGQKNKAIIAYIISCLFHTTALIFLLYPLARIVVSYFKGGKKTIVLLFIFGGILFSSTYYIEIISIVSEWLPFLPARYIKLYVESIEFESHFPVVITVINICCFFMISYCKYMMKSNRQVVDLLFFMCVLNLSLTGVASINMAFARLPWYFQTCDIFIMALFYNLIKKDIASKSVYISTIFSVMLFYFIYLYVIGLNGNVYPYKFFFE